MMKIVEYVIEWNTNPLELAEEVCVLIGHGWYPYGELTFNNGNIHQIMVKYGAADEKDT